MRTYVKDASLTIATRMRRRSQNHVGRTIVAATPLVATAGEET